MVMRFQRSWDFNPGNKKLMLNDLTQDIEVIAALQEALAIAQTGVANQIPYSNLVSGLQAVQVQAAIDEVTSSLRQTQQEIEGIIGGAGLNAEGVMDLLGTTGLVAGDNVTLTYDDVAGTLTVAATTPPGLDTEAMMDHLGMTGLVAGPNITLTYDDIAGTLTITGADAPAAEPGLWKGAWTAAPEEIIYTEDFSVAGDDWTGTAVQLDMATATGTSKPAYSHVKESPAASMTGVINTHILNLLTLPEAAGRLLTKMTFWWAGRQDRGATYSRTTRFEFLNNGTSVVSRDATTSSGTLNVTFPWIESTILDPAGTITGRLNPIAGTSNAPTARMAVTGVTLYAAVQGWTGYQTGQYVVHNGKLWVSDVDGNLDEPGVGVGWTEKVLTPDPEQVRDTIGTALVAGANVTITVNDAGDTITIASADTNTTDPEVVRDTMAAALVAGANVTITPNDAGDTITIAAAGASPATVTPQTGTAYTLTLGDAGDFITMDNAAASTLTVPPNSAVAFPVGTVIYGAQLGAGQVTLTPGAGVTINGTPGLKVSAQYGGFRLVKLATDTWLATGDLAV